MLFDQNINILESPCMTSTPVMDVSIAWVGNYTVSSWRCRKGTAIQLGYYLRVNEVCIMLTDRESNSATRIYTIDLLGEIEYLVPEM
jgi:hypothetical protein